MLQAMLTKAADQAMQIDWQLTQKELIEQDGIPQMISSN